MNREFSFYEFVAVLVPGFLLFLVIAVPFRLPIISLTDVSVGAATLLLILSYAAGQTLQAVGNILETVWWKLRGGRPTSWILSDHKALRLMSLSQIVRVRTSVAQLVPYFPGLREEDIKDRDWFGIVAEIYASLSDHGLSKRVDIFNGNYGLFRGLSGALLIGIVVALLEWLVGGKSDWRLICVLAVFLVMALYRMDRFGKHYARELYAQVAQQHSIKHTESK